MELKVFESPGQEWDEFASRYTDLIFYQSIWSKVLREGLGGQPLYFYLKKGGEMVAGLPGILLDFKIIKILYASIPYGHFIGERSCFKPFLEFLEKEFKKRSIDQVRIAESPFSESYHLESFNPISAKCTLLDLRGYDKEKIWEGYNKNIRRDVRKSQKSGVTIHRGDNRQSIYLFYKLYLASMERNRAIAKYPLRWFETVYNIIISRGLGEIVLAEMNTVVIAGALFIYSPSSTHYFHNGSHYEFLKFCPNELIVHTSIEETIVRKGIFFDFMGSDPQDISLLRFKEKWGSQSKDIYTDVKDYHPIRCKMWEMGKRLASTKVGSGLLRRFRD
jgi:hypothetical protein